MSTEAQRFSEEVREREQSILLSYIDEIIKSSGQDEIVYSNFVQVETSKPYEFISRVTGNPSAAVLTKLPPSILSLLVPRIRLFVMKKDPRSGRDTPVEMVFDDSVSEKSLEDILEGRATTIDAVNVQRFSYNYNATDYSQVKNNVTAELVLSMRSIESFTKVRTKKLSGTDKEIEYQYSDLVLQTVKRPKDPGNNEFKMFAIIGYATPTDESLDLLREEASKLNSDPLGNFSNGFDFGVNTIINAVKNNSIGMYLTLIGHDIKYEQDGSVEITLEYSACIEGILTNPKSDVFMLSRDKAQNLKDLRAKYNEKITNLEESISSYGSEETKKRIKRKNPEKDLEEVKEEKRLQLTAGRRALHGALIQKMLDNNRVYTLSVSRKYQLPDNINDEAKDDIIKKQANSSIRDLYQIGSVQRAFSGDRLSKRITGDLKTYQDSNDVDSILNFSDAVNDRFGADEIIFGAKNDIKISYFFFGDLLNIVFDILFDEELSITNGGEVRPVVGPIQFFRKDDSAKGIEDRFIEASYNLSDIPVSVNMFVVYLVDKIVKSNRTTYPIKIFIRDVITDLIGRMLNARTTGAKFYTQARVNMNILSGTDNGIDKLTGKSTNNGRLSSYGLARVTDRDLKENNIRSINTIGELERLRADITPFNYVFLFASLTEFSNLVRDRSKGQLNDEERGIYTYRIGEDRGLVRNINFSRSDQPYAREARIQRAAEQDDRFPDIFTYFQEKYDANLELYGNPFVQPGQYIYIDPNTLGSRSREEVSETARTLGLGGYYMLVNVSGELTRNDYEVSAKGVWQSDGNKVSRRKLNQIEVDDGYGVPRK